ncbi:hypothetical protein FKM82_026255 [Ascaphus truei]
MADLMNGSLNTTMDATYPGSGAHSVRDTPAIRSSIVACFAVILCLFGMVGNGIVFWMLGFRMKMNKYTVYILNLAVADFICLIFVSIIMVLMVNQILNLTHPSRVTVTSLEVCYDFGFFAGMFILTAISVDGCLSVLFPIWHTFSRPTHISPITCGLLWVFAGTVSLINNLVCPPMWFMKGTKECTGVQIFTSILTFVIFIPLMLFSSFTLIYMVMTTSPKCRPPKMYVAIVVVVLVFFISVAPIKLVWILLYFKVLPTDFNTNAFLFVTIYCAVFKCSANPGIYFLVGRHWNKRFGGAIQKALGRVFKEDDTEQKRESEGTTTIVSTN